MALIRSQVVINNETAGVIKFVKHHDYGGNLPNTPYPEEIQPAEWAEFLHHGSVGNPSQSIGAVVYRCTNGAGQEWDWMMSWSNIYGITHNAGFILRSW
ncbi:23 kDa jasmonate-induced protein-like [Diospyros lotus]|uniref:23 kDa jasmonate-induced protein-like n=1 Tax=Diospyros lotus TaxID=55363 RepID=UPI00225A243D|nr:23 kDa jasmonate-induced protein-like [Diospyros lotus]